MLIEIGLKKLLRFRRIVFVVKKFSALWCWSSLSELPCPMQRLRGTHEGVSSLFPETRVTLQKSDTMQSDWREGNASDVKLTTVCETLSHRSIPSSA
jgi:hypothetical protein